MKSIFDVVDRETGELLPKPEYPSSLLPSPDQRCVHLRWRVGTIGTGEGGARNHPLQCMGCERRIDFRHQAYPELLRWIHWGMR